MTDATPEPGGLNISVNGLLSKGDTAEIVADIFPARVTPRPSQLPAGVSKVRAVVTDKALTLAWAGGYQGGIPIINRLDLPLTGGALNASFRGGEVDTEDGETFTVERGTGCSCGAAGLKNWNPFPQVRLTQRTPPARQTGRYTRV